MLLPPRPARRLGSGSAASTDCGSVRGDRASRRLAGPASPAWATAGRAVGSLAGAGHLRARRVASRAYSSGTPRGQSRPNNRRPCKYFKKGTCNLGSNCPFSHARTPPKKQKRRRSRGGVLGDVTNAGGGHPAPFAPPYPHPYGYGYYVPPPPPPPRQMQAPSGADGRRGA